MKNYLGRALNGAVVGLVLIAAGVTLAACGADPGQAIGGGAGSAIGGGLLDLANKALPALLTAIGVPSALTGAIPAVLNMLRNQKAKETQTVIATQNDAMSGLLQLLPVAVDAVRSRSDNKVDDGVQLLKALFADRIAMLGIDDGALRQLVNAKLGAPSAPPA